MSPVIFSFCYTIDYYISKTLGKSMDNMVYLGGGVNSVSKAFIMN